MNMSDQAASLRRKFNQSSNTKQAKTISIVSGKGGVGKSNTALNLSIELQQQGKKVLLFDLDIGMGNIDILMGIHAKFTILDMFSNFLPIRDIIELGPSNLSYIAGGTGRVDLFYLTEAKMNYFYEQYEMIQQSYDYIIFDLGAGVSKESLYFTLSSDACFVVTTPEPTSLMDAYGMVKHILNNRKKMPIYVLMNRCQKQRECLDKLNQFQQVIEKFLQEKVFLLGMLPEDKIVTKAVNKQIPYIHLNKNAPISKAIKIIVARYLRTMNEQDAKESLTFVQRVKQLITKR